MPPSIPIARSNRLRTGRWSATDQVYFVTTSTLGRVRWFDRWECAHEVAKLHSLAGPFFDAQVLAWVLMPDHWHGLIQLASAPLTAVLHRFKTLSGFRTNVAAERTGRVWQSGFHDHAVRCDESLVELARYLVMNPVRAGLVARVGDYAFWDAVWIDRGSFAP
ncbi:MAG TPA: transposase [Xanthomonadales bacterium]|nr:transposase [Xanthomonadales bacterium]